MWSVVITLLFCLTLVIYFNILNILKIEGEEYGTLLFK